MNVFFLNVYLQFLFVGIKIFFRRTNFIDEKMLGDMKFNVDWFDPVYA